MKIKELIGAIGIFNNRGMFVVYPHVKALKLYKTVFGCTWMIMGERNDDLIISSDGVTFSFVNKSFVKMIKVKK